MFRHQFSQKSPRALHDYRRPIKCKAHFNFDIINFRVLSSKEPKRHSDANSQVLWRHCAYWKFCTFNVVELCNLAL